MKPQTFIAAMIFSISALGQDNLKSVASKEFNRILIGVNVSTDYCYRTLENFDGSNQNNKNDEPKIGYTTGLNICKKISKHVGIEVGLQYSNKGFSSQQSDLTFGINYDPRYGFIYASNGSALPTQIKSIYNYIYLDVPISAIFRFGERRIQFITSVGIATNILLNTSVKRIVSYDNGETQSQTNKFNSASSKLNISPTISVGINYKISDHINLSVAPTFRYGLVLIIDSPFEGYLWSAGLNITCYYAIK